MTSRAHLSRLMRRLGFKAVPPDPKTQILARSVATYWDHEPSGVRIVLCHDERYSAAQIVRCAISAGIVKTLREVRFGVTESIDQMRRDHEDAAIAYQRTKR